MIMAILDHNMTFYCHIITFDILICPYMGWYKKFATKWHYMAQYGIIWLDYDIYGQVKKFSAIIICFKVLEKFFVILSQRRIFPSTKKKKTMTAKKKI